MSRNVEIASYAVEIVDSEAIRVMKLCVSIFRRAVCEFDCSVISVSVSVSLEKFDFGEAREIGGGSVRVLFDLTGDRRRLWRRRWVSESEIGELIVEEVN